MARDPSSISGDDALLDELLDRAVADFQDGRAPDLAGLLQGHERLFNAAQDIILLAREIAKLETVPRLEAPPLRGYQIISALGRGGMGSVFLARQERLGGRLVAVKILPAAASLSPRARERFITEARAMARIHHPNVVAIHDVIEQHGVLAYAMEFVDGPSLAQIIDQLRDRGAEGPRDRGKPVPAPSPDLSPDPSGTGAEDGPALIAGSGQNDLVPFDSTLGSSVPRSLGPSDVSRLGISIARALGAVHRAGLLHRDVKPSNILIRRDGTPLLSDFGLAREVDSTLTQQGHFAGTPAYAPPEQLRGETDRIDVRSDVYALGVTLYHALALQPPFRGDDPAALLRQAEAGRCVPLRKVNPRLPREIEIIVSKAMDADPARRYATADELADDLERMLSLQPILARPAGPVTRTLKLVRRNRAAALGILAGGVVTLALAVAAMVYGLVVPKWVEGHVREARLALLDPTFANVIFIHEFWGMPESRMDPEVFSQQFGRALANYNAALRWRPFDRAIRAERDIVRSATRHVGKGDQGGSLNQARRHEGKSEISDLKSQLSSPSPSVPLSLRAFVPDSSDLRSAGLYAYLTGDVNGALDAWSRYELERDPTAPPDPLVEAALGTLYLIRDEPARAYPRLRDACQALPDVGFLTAYLAEAALQCGDLDHAERLLERAARMPRLDALYGLERVTANLHAAAGRDKEAERIYALIEFQNIVVAFNYAQFLESRGRLHEALDRYEHVVRRLPQGERPRRAFVSAMDGWWVTVTPAGRMAKLRAALDENPGTPDSFVARLRLYAESHEAIPARRERCDEAEAVRPLPSWLRGFVAPWLLLFPPTPFDLSIFRPFDFFSSALFDSFSSPPLESLSVSELAERMEVTDMHAWANMQRSPHWMKNLQAVAWRWSVRRTVAGGAVAVVALAGALTNPAAAQIIKDLEFNVDGALPSADPEIGYFDGFLPEASVFSVSGGVLQQRFFGIHGGYAAYRHPTDPTNPATGTPIDSAKSSTAEWRVKVVRIEGTKSVRFELYDGGYYSVWCDASGVRTFSQTFAVHEFPINVFEFHVYRIEADAGTDTFRLFIDDMLVFSGVAPALSGYNGFFFGDDANIDGSADADWDYVRVWQCPGAMPLAFAGDDQSMHEGSAVMLDGSTSRGLCGDPLYTWSQVAGTVVTLDLTDPARPTFTAPDVPMGGETLTFQLVVSDGARDSEPDTVDVTVTNVNHAPAALAGDDQIVVETAPVTLDGSNSYDVDGETLSYTWVQTAGQAVTLDLTDPVKPTFTAPLVGPAGETLSFDLTVSDGEESSSDSVSVLVENVNHAPTADAGDDQTRTEGAAVTLDATGSSDPDGDTLTYVWEQVSGTAVTLTGADTATPGFTAPQVSADETLVFRVIVDDGYGGTASDEVAVTVQDTNSPPACDLARPSLSELWPPNHKMIEVSILGVTDPDNNTVAITIVDVTQDEPIDGLGDGDTAPDAVMQGATVLLRAERAGMGNGRVYRVTFQADDGFGGACIGQVTVCAPRSKGKNAASCADDGQAYSSLGP